jgi:hypothetical protein
MIDLLFIALFQAAAGPPEPAATEPAPAEQTAAEPAQEEAASNGQTDQRRRCRAREVTGTRLSSVMTCRSGPRSGQQDLDTRDTLHDMQRPAPLQGN